MNRRGRNEIRNHAMQVKCATEGNSTAARAALLLALRQRLVVIHTHVKLGWWGWVGETVRDVRGGGSCGGVARWRGGIATEGGLT